MNQSLSPSASQELMVAEHYKKPNRRTIHCGTEGIKKKGKRISDATLRS
jgi:hypothetical protein